MRGNDIIDIKLAAKESNWQRKGWLEKIFTPEEQTFILQSSSPEKTVWTLWSMKESAYKIYTRQYGGRFFAPKKFNCVLFPNFTGTVTVDKLVYQTTTSITANYIYTLANPMKFTTLALANRLFLCEDKGHINQQQIIYKKLLADYAACTDKDLQHLSVIKNSNGVPFIQYKGNQVNVPVSITHHGNYAAFTIN